MDVMLLYCKDKQMLTVWLVSQHFRIFKCLQTCHDIYMQNTQEQKGNVLKSNCKQKPYVYLFIYPRVL